MYKNRSKAYDFFMITLGTLICSFAIFFFVTPSHLAIASMSGLAILMAKLLPLSVGTLLLILNIICLILAWIFVGKEFTYRTIYPSILLSLTVKVLEWIYPDQQSIMGDQFIDMVVYLFLFSLGAAMLFVRNSSSGGLDVITKIMNKYLKIELGTAMSICGMCVSVPAIFIYDIRTGILSILGTYVNGMILDHFIFGFSLKKKVCIVSDHIDEIRDFVINDMKSGATFYEATGAYDYHKYRELNVLVVQQEYIALINKIAEVDPGAFVSVYNVGEVLSHTWGRKAALESRRQKSISAEKKNNDPE